MERIKVGFLATVVLVAVASLFTVCKVTGSNSVDYQADTGGQVKFWKVTFDADGGVPEPEPNPVTVADGETIGGMPDDPAKPPAAFDGWYLGETQFAASTPVSEDITLLAKWHEAPPGSVCVTFDGDGGDPGIVNIDVSTGGTVSVAPTVTRLGWTFGGWYTQPDGGGMQFTTETEVTGAVHVYAKWLAPTYQQVLVSPDAITIERGTSYEFIATVEGQNNPDQSVSWTLDGTTNAGTTLVGGLLTIAANETAAGLTVKAASTVASIEGQAAVSVFKGSFTALESPSGPDVLPTELALGSCFSNDGNYLAVLGNSPTMVIYKRSSDVFTKLTTDAPDIAPSAAYLASFSPDDDYLAVVTGASPHITLYKRNGDSFIKQPNLSSLPTGEGHHVMWSPDGSHLVVGNYGATPVTVYKRAGDTFTKLSSPANPAGNVFGGAYSPDGSYMAIAHAGTPFISLYKRSEDSYTKLSNPSVIGGGQGGTLSFSPDGRYLAAAFGGTPNIVIYELGENDTFTALPGNGGVSVSGNGSVALFSPNGAYLALGHANSPYVTIYKNSGGSFVPATATAPPIAGRRFSFSPDGKYLATPLNASPFLSVYKLE